MGDSFPGIFTYSTNLVSPFLGGSRNVELAAPQCAAGFRIRLNLHGRPLSWEFVCFRTTCCQALLSNASRVPKVTCPFRPITLARFALKRSEIANISFGSRSPAAPLFAKPPNNRVRRPHIYVRERRK